MCVQAAYAGIYDVNVLLCSFSGRGYSCAFVIYLIFYSMIILSASYAFPRTTRVCLPHCQYGVNALLCSFSGRGHSCFFVIYLIFYSIIIVSASYVFPSSSTWHGYFYDSTSTQIHNLWQYKHSHSHSMTVQERALTIYSGVRQYKHAHSQ